VTVWARLAGRNMDLCGGSHCLSEFDEKGLRASVSCGESTGRKSGRLRVHPGASRQRVTNSYDIRFDGAGGDFL